MNKLAIIPARSGSKGIINKNIVDFMGQPLISHTIETVKASNLFDKIFVSTDSEDIASIAKSYGAEVPYLRPAALATDTSGAKEVIQNVLEYLNSNNFHPDVIGYFQPTSPLRKVEHIIGSMKLFLSSDADSLVSIVQTPHNMVPESQMKINQEGYLEDYLQNDNKVLLRQKKNTYFSRNGAAIYLLKSKKLKEFKNAIIGGKIIGYEMDSLHSIDIDTEVDLQIAKIYAQYLKTKGSNSEK